MSARNRRGLLRYWSVRYFFIMLVSGAVLAPTNLYIVQQNATANQHAGMERIVQDIEAAANGGLPENDALGRMAVDRAEVYNLASRPIVLIADGNGRIVRQFPSLPTAETRRLLSMLPGILTGEAHFVTLEATGEQASYVVAVHPMKEGGSIAGHVLYMTPAVDTWKMLHPFQIVRIAAFCIVLLIGWCIVYLMTRRLVKPIQKSVEAANRIVAGDYDIRLDARYQEKEIDELMRAMKEMADRLKRLEALRNQLLAGVTHELKTPIASISGLIQAVRDGVVTGDEAKTFLDDCLKHSGRLQKMVEDLLDFNSFASHSVAVRTELVDLDETLRDIVERWRLSLQRSGLTVAFKSADGSAGRQTMSDAARIEQIMVNLLNNASDAMAGGGTISIRLTAEPGMLRIAVQDTGGGIPVEEQADVFEPFYRGSDKKKRIRGLGLGLPFSRLIARSLGGELALTGSSPEGTTFTLSLPHRRL